MNFIFFKTDIKVVLFILSILGVTSAQDAKELYDLGVGIADITGPAADVTMMGYGKSNQETKGIHFRLYSRAFIIGQPNGRRVVYASCDIAMISTVIKREVSKILHKKFGDLYTEDNVMLSATHTHSGPGGFLQYVLYLVPTQGFNRQNFNTIVWGIVRSIERAHQNIKKGYLYYAEGELHNASINRSPASYEANSNKEKARHSYNTDKLMQMLKFVASDGELMGMITWFPVHCTSMNNTNQLISGDNKGYASLLFEKHMNKDSLPGKGPFVAAFANGNEGDVSPNTRGARCINTGMPCESHTSSCSAIRLRSNNPKRQELPAKVTTNEKCIAFGPGNDMFESTRLIGKMQYSKALELFENESLQKKIQGDIHFVHKYVDMSRQNIYNEQGRTIGTTCPPAMGYSFAAGTVDGPGAFDFRQGVVKSSPFWNLVRDFLRRPSAYLQTCQSPKPILLATGEMNFPYAWQPTIIPLQMFAIGKPNSHGFSETSIILVALPAEFTTMAGRRVKNVLQPILNKMQEDFSVQRNSLLRNKQELTRIATLKKLPKKSLFSRRFIYSYDAILRRHPRDSLQGLPVINFSDQGNSPASNSQYQTAAPELEGPTPDPEMVKKLSATEYKIEVPKPDYSSTENGKAVAIDNSISKIEGTSNQKIILSGLSNAYSSYVTTFEEYQVQRYEAASTLYGQHTLTAYLQQFKLLANWLQNIRFHGSSIQPRANRLQPPDLLDKQLQLKPGVIFDGKKRGTNFGDTLIDVKPSYHPGQQVVAVFVSGHPQNWNSTEGTYLTIEKLDDNNKLWKVIATDANWETRYVWTRTSFLTGESVSTVIWDIPEQTSPGIYRIRHFGASRNLFQTLLSYVGISSSFKVQPR